MKLYVAIWEDRHNDTTAHVFSDRDAAIQWAKAKCKEFDRLGDYEEFQVKGWEFSANYSCEGDGIRVVETELDKELPHPEPEGD